MSTTNLTSLFGSLYGSLYFATVLSTALYGVVCMQTFFYFVHYENDPLRTKILVATVWAINTIHEALNIAGAYKYIMAGLLNPFSFVNGVPEMNLLSVSAVLVTMLTQGFLVYRIYIFSGKSLVGPILWVFPALADFVCTFVYVGKSLYSSHGVHVVALHILDSGPLQALATVCLAVEAGVDIMIAITMTFLLARQRSATRFVSTAHVLQRLTVFSVNTGVWTATFALLSVILLHVLPSSTLYIVFAIPLCSVYCNTLLANLNARAYIRGETTTHDVRTNSFSQSPRSWVSDFARHNESRKQGGDLSLSSMNMAVTFPDADRTIVVPADPERV